MCVPVTFPPPPSPVLYVQYSPLSSAATFVILEEEQEGNGWEDVEFRFHAVPIPRGVCREQQRRRTSRAQRAKEEVRSRSRVVQGRSSMETLRNQIYRSLTILQEQSGSGSRVVQ
ncbi:hypothetical protein NDU88_005463 [Pleurodeles waltl]|uniref:Uncharacterized protein n=1 Tax=Pleurodeles waltl TaxID=8319 RepID=A0AAV7VLK3_PLEWA|nr:hypothetical protein NDU88_005463 [Pleurodeles waltl]